MSEQLEPKALHYGIRTESDHPSAMWEVCDLATRKTLHRFGTYETADAVARLLNVEREKWDGRG